MSVFKRLLSYLHAAVFDTSPVYTCAFRVSSAGSVTWSVVDESLVAVKGGVTFTYPLQSYTVAQLAAKMTLDGFTVAAISPTVANLSASVLLEMDGNSSQPYGDQLLAMNNDLLRSLFGGYARELRTARAQIPEMLKQMVITSSEGEWVNLWGALYGIERKTGSSDAEFGALIPAEAFRLRVNAFAIEKAIKDQTGYRVRITEPWEDMFRADISALSGQNRFYNGSTIGPHLIKPIAYTSIVWDGIIDIIKRNCAAGVTVLSPEEQARIGIIDPISGFIRAAAWSMRNATVYADDFATLDTMLSLSNYEINRNTKSAITSYYSKFRSLAFKKGQGLSAGAWPADDLTGYAINTDFSQIVGSVVPAAPQYAVSAMGFAMMTGSFIQVYQKNASVWGAQSLWGASNIWNDDYDAGIVGQAITVLNATWTTPAQSWPATSWAAA